MNNIVTPPQPKIEKQLRNNFNILDTALSCCYFIVFGLFVELITLVMPSAISSNLFYAIFMSFLIEAVFGIAGLVTASTRKVKFIEATNLNKKIDIKTILLCIVIAVVSIYAFNSVSNAFAYALQNLGYKQQVSNFVIPNVQTYLLYVVLICISPAIFEELLFRGVTLNGLKKLGTHKAVIISALFFSFMHGGPDQTIHQLILGVIMGYVFVYSGSIWSTIIIHFLNNFIALTSLFIVSLNSPESVTEIVQVSWGEIGIMLILGLIGACIGGTIVYWCIRGIKAIKEHKDKGKDKLNILDKVDLSDQDIQELKEQANDIKGQQLSTKEKTTSIWLFVASAGYLIFQWITTLVAGFIL